MNTSANASNAFAHPALEAAPLLLLIDGHSLAFRAYYAFATSRKGPLKTTTGIPTSICFGFLNSLVQVIESQQPQYVAIAFDRAEPTFRHEADAAYKADRKETPEDFIPDLHNLQRLLSVLNLAIVTVAGYEADDVLGTLARKASAAGYQVKIVSGDRDLFQLVNPQQNINVLYLSNSALKSSISGGYTEIDAAAVEEKLGIKPEQVVDFKALCGDKSDNIPGVNGIGEKTAVKLLQEYGTLEAIYRNLDKISGAVQKKLEAGREAAKHSQYLAQIHLDTPIDSPVEDYKLQGFDRQVLVPLLEELELKTFLRRIERLQEIFGCSVEAVELETTDSFESQQLSLLPEAEVPPTPELVEDTLSTQATPQTPLEPQASVTPQIVDTPEKLTQLVALLKSRVDPQQPVAWDTETTALNPRDASLVGIGCCWGEPTEVAYIPIGHLKGKCLDREQVLSTLRPILEGAEYPKAFQNAKFDRAILLHQGIRLEGVVFDTMLASYVLHPEQSHKLEDIAERYLSGITSQRYQDLNIPKGKTLADLDVETVARYCGLDAYTTFCLVHSLRAELAKAPELHRLLLAIEQPLEPVLATMENDGVRIDTAYLKALSQQLETELQAIEKKAYDYAGEIFNLGSPKQLGDILFEKLSLDRKKSRKTKTGYSTDHATLEKLQDDHPIVSTLLQHRTLSKLKSTYVDALPALVRPDTGRVHTNFNQTVTTTGRLSSSDPNLQNIPIRTEFSRKIRQAFVPEEGWLLVSIDYSQIELRILAHLSQQPILLDAYRNSRDVHSVTAQLLFDKAVVTAQERRLGKIINFGVIYGMGAQRFAREAGVSAQEGRAFIDKYRLRYAEVFAYLEKMKQEAIALGYVTTLLGRRRYFNFDSKSLLQLRGCDPQALALDRLKINYSDAQLLRAAANAPIQGSSADIIKIAMIKLHQILPDYQARLLLQVHDELVFEVPPDEWQELKPKVVAAMENALELSVPLVADVSVGRNWMDAD